MSTLIYCWCCDRELASLAEADIDAHTPYPWTTDAGEPRLEVECHDCVERAAERAEGSGYQGSDTIESRVAAMRLK